MVKALWVAGGALVGLVILFVLSGTESTKKRADAIAAVVSHCNGPASITIRTGPWSFQSYVEATCTDAEVEERQDD